MNCRLTIVALSLVVTLCGAAGYEVYSRISNLPPPPVLSSHEESQVSPWRYRKALTKQEKQHVLDGQFLVLSSTQSLPERLRQAFKVITREPRFALANPGEKYQVTDVIHEPGLPFRRLVFAGVNEKKWFIHYEQGGIGHSYSVVIFDHDGDSGPVRFEWGADVGRAVDLKHLRQLISEDRSCDDAGYYW